MKTNRKNKRTVVDQFYFEIDKEGNFLFYEDGYLTKLTPEAKDVDFVSSFIAKYEENPLFAYVLNELNQKYAKQGKGVSFEEIRENFYKLTFFER